MKRLWVLSLACLTGCAYLLEGEAPRALYTLKSDPVVAAQSRTLPALTVDLPFSDLSLDTPRIAVTPSLYQRDYLAEGEWSDRLPKAVQDVLIDSFSQRWGGERVNRSLQTDQLLQTDIQDFSVYGLGSSAPYVQIKLLFKVVDFPNRRVIASHLFCEKVPVVPCNFYGIVVAFNKGMNCLVGKAVVWREKVISHQ